MTSEKLLISTRNSPNPSKITSQTPSTTTTSDQQKKEGFANKLLQSLTLSGRRRQTSTLTPRPNLNDFNETSQELLIRAMDQIQHRDSQQAVAVLDESRDILRGTLEELKREQNECRRQLEKILRQKQTDLQKKHQHAIPLSTYLQQKRAESSATVVKDVPASGITPTYQAYFEALMNATKTHDQQTASDRAAVMKYLRKRERRKRAEENRKTSQMSDDALEKETAGIIEKMDGMDVKLEHERQRQTNLLRSKIQEKLIKRKTETQANDILDEASEAQLARERVEQMHREKIEARLSAARVRSTRLMEHVIHVPNGTNSEENASGNGKQMVAAAVSLELVAETLHETLTRIDI